jgi:hypothetical protein
LATEWLGFYSRQAKDISLTQSVQTGTVAHPASYSLGTGSGFPWHKTIEVLTFWHRSFTFEF